MATETSDVSDDETQAVEGMKALVCSPLVTVMLWIERTGAMQGRALEIMQRKMRVTGKRMSTVGIPNTWHKESGRHIAEVMGGWLAPWEALEECRIEEIVGLGAGAWSGEVHPMRMAPMRMVGIDLTEKQDSSCPTRCWEFQHCRRVRGVALDKVRHYENGVFIGSIVTKAPNGCWVPTRLAVYSFKVREIVPADRWDVWCGRQLVGRRMSPSDHRELTTTIYESVLRAARHLKEYVPDVQLRIDKPQTARESEIYSRQLWMKGELVLNMKVHSASSLRTWVLHKWLPSTKNVAQVLTMRLLKDTMPCDVATTWGLSWFQSNGRVDMPAPGSTTWELSRTRTMKPQNPLQE